MGILVGGLVRDLVRYLVGGLVGGFVGGFASGFDFEEDFDVGGLRGDLESVLVVGLLTNLGVIVFGRVSVRLVNGLGRGLETAGLEQLPKQQVLVLGLLINLGVTVFGRVSFWLVNGLGRGLEELVRGLVDLEGGLLEGLADISG